LTQTPPFVTGRRADFAAIQAKLHEIDGCQFPGYFIYKQRLMAILGEGH
jgi:hypothetical protein